jgi:glucose/arabinose dehydrogenase
MQRLLALAAVTVAIPVTLGIAYAAPLHSPSRTDALGERVPNSARKAPGARRGGAPAERLPDLDQETPTALWIMAAGSTYYLGFRSAVRNIGDGPLIIDGSRPNRSQPTMSADQLIARTDGSLERVQNVGQLRYVHSVDHQHWHLLGFDHYELRRAGSPGVIAVDRKTGFCLGDRYPVTSRVLARAVGAKVYRTNCNRDHPEALTVREGISVGWGDDYKAFLEGQDLPVNGLEDGRYVLVHRVNADGRLRELTDRNNAASVLFELHWNSGKPSIKVLAQCPERADCEDQPTVRTVATGLQIPWDIAFLPDGSAFITEQPGRVRLLNTAGELRPQPVAIVPVSTQGEGGLLGIAVDPHFADNRYVYLYFTSAAVMKLERWRWTGSELVRETTIVSAIRAGKVHDSGRIAFGPDGRLYVATGDAGKPALAQSPQSLNGKFLTLNPAQYHGAELVRPTVLARGLRNPQGFDWQPGTGILLSNDHGPSGFDGPEGFDEVDQIVPGGNYGWPKAIGVATAGGKYRAPLEVYRQPIAPSGGTFLRAPSLWTGSYVLAGLRGQTLRRLELGNGRVVVDEPLLDHEFGRLRTVKEGPNGCIYVLTSNRDGRGKPVADDDRILCVTPPHD